MSGSDDQTNRDFEEALPEAAAWRWHGQRHREGHAPALDLKRPKPNSPSSARCRRDDDEPARAGGDPHKAAALIGRSRRWVNRLDENSLPPARKP